jgi:hypothetical protein
VFADLGIGTSTLVALTDSASQASGKRTSGLGDAGGGLVLRGRFYDRDVHLRLDVPVFVNKTALAGGKLGRNTSVSLRWWITTGDLW